jgi:phenylpyruvate tautomerase PptA (4-oxalocrotonate tautomerase family)
MAQVKIYGHRERLIGRRQAISDAVQTALVEALTLPPDKRFHRFFPLDPDHFFHPPDRSPDYTIIEISMFEGRSAEAKHKLIRLLFARLQAVGIAPPDLEITITETPRGNWGIRGVPGDELSLLYEVDV